MKRISTAACRFYVEKAIRDRPGAVVSLAAAVLALIGALAGLLAAAAQSARLETEIDELRRSARPVSVQSRNVPQLPLTDFHSSQLVRALDRVADATKTGYDEITFSLDPATNKPFLRYRASMTVSGTYPNIRNFLSAIAQDIKFASLDSISCARAGIQSAELTCDLTLSAFYRKPQHG
ncbi:hypothetical protein E4K72_05605 [Oxalobacteraceae bacterium OM1]|nr:hypothetical protein E4K72_05605 [Oxalobacteraceae bacterium OM1]